jgi:hypothetical protein
MEEDSPFGFFEHSEGSAKNHSFMVHFTGGLRAYKADGSDNWLLEPVSRGSRPHICGVITYQILNELIAQLGAHPVATQSITRERWITHSQINAVTQHGALPPDVLWSNINHHLRDRANALENAKDIDEISKIIDEMNTDERLAHFISLSLGQINRHICRLFDQFHSQLLSAIPEHEDGYLYANSFDFEIATTTHDIYSAFGTLRDYLFHLVAYRLGIDVDSASKLLQKLSEEDIQKEPLLKRLRARGILSTNDKDRLVFTDWLSDLSLVRNTFVHRRPYGSIFLERSAHLIKVKCFRDLEVFRYYKPVVIGDEERDLGSMISYHYHRLYDLATEFALISGYNSSILSIPSHHIHNMKIT